jgi:hypothetical protein
MEVGCALLAASLVSPPSCRNYNLTLVRRPRGRLFLNGYAIWFIAAPDMLVHIGRGYEGRD